MNENQSLINWYPGHMAKTKRLLEDQIKRIDLIIELCDARLPYSSRNPDLDRMISRKRRLLFLNKSDLADQQLNREWIKYFRDKGTEAHLTDAVRMHGKETIGIRYEEIWLDHIVVGCSAVHYCFLGRLLGARQKSQSERYR